MEKQDVELKFDEDFPLFNDSGVYKVVEIRDWCQQQTQEIAERFDKRNENDSFTKKITEYQELLKK